MPAAIDLTGKRFGRLVAMHLAPKNEASKARRWVCGCDCGETITVQQGNLGRCINSCGCLRKELLSLQKTNLKHGKRKTRAYSVWTSMMNRCRNPKVPAYKNYGGRGIVVCIAWHRFEAFYADMGDPPPGFDLDRIDNNGNYEPNNCRWATRSENIKNSRARITDAKGCFTKEVVNETWNEKSVACP